MTAPLNHLLSPGRARRSVAARALPSPAARWISPLAILAALAAALAPRGVLPPKTLAAPTDIVSHRLGPDRRPATCPSALLVSLRRAALGLLLGVVRRGRARLDRRARRRPATRWSTRRCR